MGKNTPQAMRKDVLGTSMPHPGVIPGPGGSKSGCFLGQNAYFWTHLYLELHLGGA